MASSTVGAGALAELLRSARQRVKDMGRRTDDVDWSGLLDGPLPELVRQGRTEEARRLIEEAIGV
jgi:hypothetical protein